MDSGQEMISKAACKLAAEMPLPTLQIVARLIGDSPNLPAAKGRMLDVPQPHHRQLAANFIDECMAVPEMVPQMVAIALLTAGVSAKVHRDAQSIELAWTGPTLRPLHSVEPSKRSFRFSIQLSIGSHWSVMPFTGFRISAKHLFEPHAGREDQRHRGNPRQIGWAE